MQKMARGQAFVDDWYPPARCSNMRRTGSREVLDTAEKLLAWCKANPGRFMYARPANSGPGRNLRDGPALPPRRQAT